LLWLVNFMNLLNLYFLTNWLPTAVREFGFSNPIAVRAGTFVQIGGLAGGLALGLFAQRLGLIRVLTASFLIGCLSLGTISHAGLPLAALFAVAFLAGFAISGGQVGVNALTATCYPTSLRATGIGASLGVGRIGAILGPAIAGALLLRHWHPRSLFLAATIPAMLSALTVFSLRWRLHRSV
jgi:AAHS family 4-hydroxybenzoate transporter-like MFS transporter